MQTARSSGAVVSRVGVVADETAGAAAAKRGRVRNKSGDRYRVSMRLSLCELDEAFFFDPADGRDI